MGLSTKDINKVSISLGVSCLTSVLLKLQFKLNNDDFFLLCYYWKKNGF